MRAFVTNMCTLKAAVLLLYMAGVLALIPLARDFLRQLSFFNVTGWIVALGAIGAAVYLRYLASYPSPRPMLLHLLAFATILCFYFFFVVSPSEWLHLPVYGVLWIFLRQVFVFWPALLIGAGYGCIEELLQSLSPDRFADPRDVVLNFVALAAGMAFLEPLSSDHKQQSNQGVK